MLYQDKIYEGLAIEIVVYDGEYTGRYRTKVEEVGERILSIGVPVADRQFVPLREGTELQITFGDETSVYSFRSRIIRRIAVPIPTFILEFPNQITKIQRRQYVRVPYVNALKYLIIERDGVSEERNGFIINLSGGGMLFKSSLPVVEKAIIIIKTKLDRAEVEIPAMVIRCNCDDERNDFVISVQFHEISERLRDRIVRFVFEVQREMLKKGLV